MTRSRVCFPTRITFEIDIHSSWIHHAIGQAIVSHSFWMSVLWWRMELDRKRSFCFKVMKRKGKNVTCWVWWEYRQSLAVENLLPGAKRPIWTVKFLAIPSYTNSKGFTNFQGKMGSPTSIVPFHISLWVPLLGFPWAFATASTICCHKHIEHWQLKGPRKSTSIKDIAIIATNKPMIVGPEFNWGLLREGFKDVCLVPVFSVLRRFIKDYSQVGVGSKWWLDTVSPIRD